ncbi:MAG: cupin domain-containing protein [Pseudomonadota bacterium]
MPEEMAPIANDERRVCNIHDGGFEPFVDSSGRHDGDILRASPGRPDGYGFYVYRMPPGHTTTSHVHESGEEFLVLEGELIDHDGYRYGPGDLVWLAPGTRHNSHSPKGCLVAVYFPEAASA